MALTGLFTKHSCPILIFRKVEGLVSIGFENGLVSSLNDQKCNITSFTCFKNTFYKHPFLKSERLKASQSYYCVTDFLQMDSIVCPIPYQLLTCELNFSRSFLRCAGLLNLKERHVQFPFQINLIISQASNKMDFQIYQSNVVRSLM